MRRINREAECEKMAECRKVLIQKLKIEEGYLDKDKDKCYCSKCYEGKSFSYRGEPPEKYVIPKGWSGFGAKFDPRLAHEKVEEIFNTYHVAYHGTSFDSIKSIIATGFAKPLPEDELIDRTIHIPEDHPKQYEIFTSPSPEYASLSKIFVSPFEFEGKKYQAMIQVYQHPDSYQKQGETVEGRCTTEKYIPQSEIEWKTDVRNDVIPCRILIKALGVKSIENYIYIFIYR